MRQTTPLAYAGQYTDAESELQYLRARYYDPATQQLLTVDPVVGMTGQPYGYAGGNPVNASDPTGLCVFGLPCPAALQGAGHLLGWAGNNAGTILPVAIYSIAVTTAVVCAFVTLGTCVAVDVALAGLVFSGGAWLASSMLPPGEGLMPDDAGAPLPVGRKGCPLNVEGNAPGAVAARLYSGHAFDRMQGRGFTPSAVENVVRSGEFLGTSEGRYVYYDAENNMTVLTGRQGRIVTVGYGRFEPRP